MTTFALIFAILLAILTAIAVAITRMRALYEAAMLAALFSLIAASLFVVLDAPDVAFTEAAVGVGISTVLMLGVLAITRSRETVTPRRRRLPGLIVVTLTGGMLGYASLDLPPVGASHTPVQQHPLTEVYLVESQSDIAIPNTVAAVLASYRGLDTLGELLVVFTAGVTVLMLLGPIARPELDAIKDLVLIDYRVLRVISAILIPLAWLFALYVQFHGEYGAGGGFQAGVIFASGFILYGLVFGLDRLRRLLPVKALWALVPLGVLLYAGVGVSNMVLGGAFLDYDTFDPAHPAHGQHLGILLVEAGIGLTVATVMISIFAAFTSRGRRNR